MHSLTSRRIHPRRRDFSIVMPSLSLRETRIVSLEEEGLKASSLSLSLSLSERKL